MIKARTPAQHVVAKIPGLYRLGTVPPFCKKKPRRVRLECAALILGSDQRAVAQKSMCLFFRQGSMKLASFNINDVNRSPSNLSWLREAEPDVVCLQEL